MDESVAREEEGSCTDVDVSAGTDVEEGGVSEADEGFSSWEEV